MPKPVLEIHENLLNSLAEVWLRCSIPLTCCPVLTEQNRKEKRCIGKNRKALV
jgi:hypothetical protein